MAEKQGDLIFPMRLEVDPSKFKSGWDDIEPELQKIIDAKPLKVRVEIDNAALKDAVAQLSKLQTGGIKPSTTAAMVVAGAKADVIKAKAVQQNVIETNKLRISNANAEKSELALERAKQRGIASVHTQNKAYQAQRGILNGMPQFVNSYISILGAYRLGKNIVDTTAEFEMQRVSLAAIIQNKTKADELFAKSVEMGIESPFMIKDIITYTKQLAAYRIETDQLFDTTKRLADVSAGLGVGMDRLILAYGQVKAASVLRGQELRQFTEAGIPMVELLADKFTILNGKATTTAEVFDMIRARGVSFEMVKEIFEDMTNAGGMFNNMQAIQAQTLKGSLTNLRDAMDKTFMQMGEGAKGPIKNLVDGLRMLMENWKEVSDVGLGVVGVLATVKIATMAYNAALGEETVSVIANIMAEKKKEAITLQRLAATRALSATEQFQIATTRKLTMADWESMAAKGQLTKLMLFQAIATKRITVMQGEILGMMIGVKRAEIAQITSKNKLIVYTKLLTAALKVQLVALRATMTALLINPLTWIAAAAFGIYKLVSGIVKYNKEYTEMADNMRKQSAQVAGEMADSYKGMATSIQEAFGKGASEQAMMSARKSMQDILEKNELIKVLLDDRLSKLLTEKERLEEVRDMWNEVHAAAKSDPGYMASAQKETGGLLNDDVVENAEKVADKLSEINSYLGKMGAKGYNVIGVRKEFDELRRQFDEGEISIDNFSSGLQSMLLNNKESLDGTVFGKLSGKVKDSRIALRGFESDIERMAKSTIAQIGAIDGVLPVFGVDKFGLSDESLGNLQSRLATQTNFWLQSLGDIDNGAKRLLTTQMKIQAQFPFKNEDPEENPYAKSYNAFLEKRGLGKVAKMGKYDMEKSDATQLESVASALKTAEEELERYNAQVKAGNNLNKIKISGKKEEIRQLKIAWAFLGGTEKSIGSKAKTTDSRIATAVNQLKVLREALSKYNKLRETIGNAAARTEIQSLYGGLTGGLSLAFSGSEMEAASKLIEAKLGKMGDEGTKAMKDAIMQRTDISFDEIAANFKRNLDQMGRKIEQTQRANEFFEKMLGLTGSEEAAARLTKAMGMAVGDMRSGYYAALGDILGHDYMQGVDLGDVKSTQDAINKMRVDGYTTAADAAQAQLDGLVDYEQKQLETILATTEEFMTAEQKKAQIARTTAKLLKDIEDNPTLSVGEKKDRSAAVSASGISAAIGVDLDEIQKSKEYVAAFDDLSRTGGMALDGIYEKLSAVAAKTGISATDLNTIMGLLQKIREQQEQANPFKAWGEAIEGYKLALASIEANGITKENQTQLVGAAEKLTQAGQNIGSVFTTVISPLQKTVTLAEEVADSLGITFGDQTKGAIDDFMKGFEIMSSGIEIVNSVLAVNDTLTKIATASKASLATTNVAAAGTEIALAGATTATGVAATGASVGFDVLAKSIWAAMAPLWPLLAVAAAVGAAIAIINAKAKKQQKIQENLANKIKDLDDAYQKLQHTAERALGSEYLATVRKEQDILLQQEKAALDQAAAERAKGRKKDLEKEKEYLRQAADYRQQALDKEEEIMAKFTGYSGATDAALSFADAWLEAYKSFASTTDAMSEKFSEMVDNMVAKSVLAAIIAAKLEPVFALIKSAYDPNGPGGANATKEEWAGIKSAMSGITIGLDSEARSAMESIGLKPGYGQDKPELSGISASVAAMDESAANTLGGYLNSGLMQWVKQTGLQNRIAIAIEANNVQKPLADIYALQSQSLAAIQSIKADTAVMVSRLTRLVENNDATMISGGQKAINVRLLN